MAYYPEEVIREVLSGNDIVDIIGNSVKLTRRGTGKYFGLCPFHREKTPSFSVDERKQLYYCFGCKAAGSAITFLMRYEGLTFADAMKVLADRIGYNLPQGRAEDVQKAELKKRMYQMHKTVARYYYDVLNSPAGEKAREYLDKRQINNATRRHFGFGFAPDEWTSVYEMLKKEGYEDSDMERSGLIKKASSGNYIDTFRDRLMIPIIDVFGNIVAFGGRYLDDRKPKYLNSPETLIYSKSFTPFNLNNAKNKIIKDIIIVEGYMDAIMLYQAGFKNVVAASGTAINEKFASVIRKYGENVVLLLDNDEAGQRAAMKAIPILSGSGLNVRVLRVTDGKDPDEFIKAEGAQAFADLLMRSQNQVVFRCEQARGKYNFAILDEKIAFTKEVASIMKEVNSGVELEAYIDEVERLTGISKQAILKEIDRLKIGAGTVTQPSLSTIAKMSRNIGKGGTTDARKSILNVLVNIPSFYDTIVSQIEPKELVDEFFVSLMENILSVKEKGGHIDAQTIISLYEDADTQSRVSEIFAASEEYDETVIKKAVSDQIKEVKKAYLTHIIEENKEDPSIVGEAMNKMRKL
ncbi:MAG: DNA primase [Firmicutes bacterium]|nr:DNA primase [Bacillota bacterium]